MKFRAIKYVIILSFAIRLLSRCSAQSMVQPPDTHKDEHEINGVRYSIALSAKQVLPYQTVRVQVEAEPSSSVNVHVQSFCRAILGLVLQDTQAERWSTVIWSTGYRVRTFHGERDLRYDRLSQLLRSKEKLQLRKGDVHSLSMAVVSQYAYSGSKDAPFPTEPQARALFHDSGTATVRLVHYVDDRNAETKAYHLGRSIECVPPATSVDIRIYDSLRKSERLSRFLCNPAADADLECAREIRRLLIDIPTSSYHDYLRFGLARAILGSNGDRALSKRNTLEFVLGVLGESQQGFRERCRTTLENLTYQSSRSAAEIDAAVSEAVAVAGRKAEQDIRVAAAAQRIASLLSASGSDVDHALYLLRQIDGKQFPFQPSVLILQRRIALTRDLPEASRVREQLNAEYFDALEWIIEQGMETTDAAWRPTLIWSRKQ